MDDRVQRKWDRLKHKRNACVNCGSINVHLNRSMNRKFNRYWLECFNCHWCGPRGNTIRGAIRKWNKYKEDV